MSAYTANNAYASYREDDPGTLEQGKYADLVVLSADIFRVDPMVIMEIGVWVGGND